MCFVAAVVALHYPTICLQVNIHSSGLFGEMRLEPVECGMTREGSGSGIGLELGSRRNGKARSRWRTFFQSTSGRS